MTGWRSLFSSSHDPVSAFIMAVCGSAVLGSLCFAVIFVATSFGFDLSTALIGAVLFLVAFGTSLFLGAIVAFALGLPFSWLLVRLGWENATTYVLSGAGLCLLPLLIAGFSRDWTTVVMASLPIYGGTWALLWWQFCRKNAAALREAER